MSDDERLTVIGYALAGLVLYGVGVWIVGEVTSEFRVHVGSLTRTVGLVFVAVAVLVSASRHFRSHQHS